MIAKVVEGQAEGLRRRRPEEKMAFSPRKEPLATTGRAEPLPFGPNGSLGWRRCEGCAIAGPAGAFGAVRIDS